MKTESGFHPQDFRYLALGVVIGAIAIVVVHWTGDADIAQSPSRICAPSPINPFDSEPSRCRTLSVEEADDPACMEEWAERRRKFLAPGKRTDDARKPLDMFPSAPSQTPQPIPPLGSAPKGE
ncbi:MAG: hypothetical protein CTY36_01530 [Methylocystis sp.]|nr:MAG: hypothetical protein CTY36_01530 [Methylocystis sp.]